ncbi:hypothetical protein SCHPADRAFT_904339 [Schizopora paradoxa]|uniref:Uncharacterized protein n=1 Tax=Schizopora paradoxa TaxID=27342 RepID=A0A0H2RMT3_9AGAM|nr:hypothetical protein SCHPADRAFT_904339 [Schizopora paradoxa]
MDLQSRRCMVGFGFTSQEIAAFTWNRHKSITSRRVSTSFPQLVRDIIGYLRAEESHRLL